MATISRLYSQPVAIAPLMYRLIEAGYYIAVFYAIMASALGIAISLLGAMMLVSLAGLCILLNLNRLVAVYRPLIPILLCAGSYLFIQLFIHGESLSLGYVRSFVPWIPALFLVQTLAYRRGFLHRYVLVAFLIGLTVLPYLDFRMAGIGVERARLDAEVTLANPNVLGAWFGFCFAYFAILGIETRKNWLRLTSWLVAIVCLGVVGFTVSRTALGAGLLAVAIAGRRFLKKGFVPAIVCLFLGLLAVQSGIFDRAFESYSVRAMEETGRLQVWPAALERIGEAPLTGFGASQVATPVPGQGRARTPHNSFLFLMLSAGVIPLLFFLVYWFQAGRNAFARTLRGEGEAAFLLPLLAYAFLVTNSSNAPFLQSWVIVVLACCLAARRSQPAVARKGARVRRG